MAALKSRPLPGAFSFVEGLQLGASLTYAEEAFRNVLKNTFGESVSLIQRELIVPKKKNRPKQLHDSSGYIMKGELANEVARKLWERLTMSQRQAIDSAEYNRYRKQQDDDFEERTVFIRSTVCLGGQKGDQQIFVIAKVVAYALSGWWHMSVIQMWYQQGDSLSTKYLGTEYHVDNHIFQIVPQKEWQPPKFLIP